VKVHAKHLGGELSKLRAPKRLGEMVAESSDDGDDLAATLSTMSGDDLDSEPPSLWASPKLPPQSDPLVPRWVGTGGLSQNAIQVGSPGQKAASSLTVMVHNFPKAYTENAFLEELRDGGFIRARDFDCLEFNLNEASCLVSFVNVGVMRSFVAAFDGREMRHANGREFVVVRL